MSVSTDTGALGQYKKRALLRDLLLPDRVNTDNRVKEFL